MFCLSAATFALPHYCYCRSQFLSLSFFLPFSSLPSSRCDPSLLCLSRFLVIMIFSIHLLTCSHFLSLVSQTFLSCPSLFLLFLRCPFRFFFVAFAFLVSFVLYYFLMSSAIFFFVYYSFFLLCFLYFSSDVLFAWHCLCYSFHCSCLRFVLLIFYCLSLLCLSLISATYPSSFLVIVLCTCFVRILSISSFLASLSLSLFVHSLGFAFTSLSQFSTIVSFLPSLSRASSFRPFFYTFRSFVFFSLLCLVFSFLLLFLLSLQLFFYCCLIALSLLFAFFFMLYFITSFPVFCFLLLVALFSANSWSLSCHPSLLPCPVSLSLVLSCYCLLRYLASVLPSLLRFSYAIFSLFLVCCFHLSSAALSFLLVFLFLECLTSLLPLSCLCPISFTH